MTILTLRKRIKFSSLVIKIANHHLNIPKSTIILSPGLRLTFICLFTDIHIHVWYLLDQNVLPLLKHNKFCIQAIRREWKRVCTEQYMKMYWYIKWICVDRNSMYAHIYILIAKHFEANTIIVNHWWCLRQKKIAERWKKGERKKMCVCVRRYKKGSFCLLNLPWLR